MILDSRMNVMRPRTTMYALAFMHECTVMIPPRYHGSAKSNLGWINKEECEIKVYLDQVQRDPCDSEHRFHQESNKTDSQYVNVKGTSFAWVDSDAAMHLACWQSRPPALEASDGGPHSLPKCGNVCTSVPSTHRIAVSSPACSQET